MTLKDANKAAVTSKLVVSTLKCPYLCLPSTLFVSVNMPCVNCTCIMSLHMLVVVSQILPRQLLIVLCHFCLHVLVAGG